MLPLKLQSQAQAPFVVSFNLNLLMPWENSQVHIHKYQNEKVEFYQESEILSIVLPLKLQTLAHVSFVIFFNLHLLMPRANLQIDVLKY